MPFTPKYNAKFIKPLLQQVVALIQRDQAAALAAIDASLPTIAEFHFGRGTRTALPWLTLSGDGPDFKEDDDLLYREGNALMTLQLDVAEFDQEVAQFRAHDYVRALDQIISSAGPNPSLAEWTAPLAVSHETVPTGTTSPLAVGSVKDVRVLSHRYTLADLDGYDSPVVRGTLSAQFHLIEK